MTGLTLSTLVVTLLALVVALGLFFGGVLGTGAHISRARAAPAHLKDHCEHIGPITICYLT